MLSASSACPMLMLFFFFNDTATTEIYTLSLHDALPIWQLQSVSDDHQHLRLPVHERRARLGAAESLRLRERQMSGERSEEHTSELQSRSDLVCRLLLEKKKKRITRQGRPM